MADALTVPFAVAAIVLGAAGVGKLRRPAPAVAALSGVGLPVSAGLVRALAAAEIVLGAWCAALPGRVTAGLLAGAYVALCCWSVVLARARLPCGCFGEGARGIVAGRAADGAMRAWGVAPALSGALASVALAAIAVSPRGAAWIVDRPAANAGVLALAICAAAYATVLVYTQLPAVWGAWSGR